MKFVFCLIVSVFLISCTSEKQETENKLLEILTELSLFENPNNIKAYLVIPNSGCGGCISGAENFVKNQAKNKTNLQVIFTKVRSRKILGITVGNDILGFKNVSFDNNNLFIREKLVSLYPVIFYFDNGYLINIEVANPENPNDVWKDLSKALL